MTHHIHSLFSSLALATTLVACGSSLPPPSDKLANAEAAARSARELGAERVPNASLHLKLATEQIERAKALMKDSDNKRADFVLQRANADAELSVMLAKEATAKTEADQATATVNKLKTGK
jgi:predicted small lipoprotein YifL